MKKTTGSILAALFVLLPVAISFAASTYTLSVDLPAAEGITVSAASVAVADNAFTPVDTTLLAFGQMIPNTEFGIWTPPNYFALDIAGDGPGGRVLTISYSDALNPNIDVAAGLGTKTTATFKKLIWTGATTKPTENDMSGHAQKSLDDVNKNAEVFTKEELAGGWLRIYVGVSTGELVGKPFTNGDASGTYTGQITITDTAS
jgi:hypothetical protein